MYIIVNTCRQTPISCTEILEEASWMDDETKQVSKEKANVINERIGYPDFILNDTELSDRYKEVATACPFQQKFNPIYE